MAFFPQILRRLFPDNLSPWGEVFPGRPNPVVSAVDGRTVALRLLRQYVSLLTFYRANAPGLPPTPFRIPEEHFHIEWPDAEVDLVAPSAAIIPAVADYAVLGLSSYVQEETRDLYSPGTVVQWQSEYTETFKIELRAASRAERRALLSGLEVALSPTEQMYGVRFVMRDYFGQLVCFTLNRREVIDDADSARNRRRAHLEVEMRFNVVALVNYSPLAPVVKVNTDVDQDTGLPVVIDTT